MIDVENFNLLDTLDINDNIEIVGFKGNIDSIPDILKKVDSIKSNCCDGCIIQLIDSKAIAGEKHLLHGIIHGILAFKRNENLAKDLGIEICVRISAQRQISKALEILGLKEGEMEIVAILINCPDYFINELSNIFNRDDSVFTPDSSILKNIYNISDEELDVMEIENILIDKTSELIVEL
ncbi:KEOPS complex subunit Cgi121 [Methanobrevibacter sp. TMH8]|uniref:KEOPS complex subunit Cgi121 n=1 Tax=Methanobrevibacter sp. TMH8 TaxID=2848611 RepID=UPI001CC93810|nr:KEOPS complex subunit Cgi121 [Methanobrevibacter sp. TMH8]